MLLVALRYRNVRQPKEYGETVRKMFETVKQQMNREIPVRQQWLQLVKDVCDYIRACGGQKE